MRLTRNTLALLSLTLALCACQSKPTREQVLEARRHFRVEVLSGDVTRKFGEGGICLTAKITNNSSLTLPYLTVLTKTFDAAGRMLMSARVPALPTSSVKPGQSLPYEYCPPLYHPNNARVEVEIEPEIKTGDARFFKELQ